VPPKADEKGSFMTGQITRRRDVEALKMAAAWPGADRATVVTLATRLAAVGADAEGYRYFKQEADAHPDRALPLALAGFFQARLGADVDAAIAKLDNAAAAELGLPHYFRGLALAALPADPGRASAAVADLEFVLAVREQFPPALMRAVHQALAAAYTALGKDDLAAEASRRSGVGSVAEQPGFSFTGSWVTREGGFRFTTPHIFRPEPGVHVMQGYDFGDFAFIETGEGIVAIDAGSAVSRVRGAIAELGLPRDQAITHLILTHGHFDHVGGAAALRGPGTQVIAQAGLPAELARQRRTALPFRYFLGDGGSLGQHIVPDRLISEPESLTAGGVEFVLYPTPGGETGDALMIHLPASGLLFTGDVMMPYLGAPFFAEGSPEGLLETFQFIRTLEPRMLIQGHAPLTEIFTIEAIPGLEAALTQLHGEVLDRIGEGTTLPEILHLTGLPEILRDHPAAVVPYLVTRDHFTARLYHQRTGYWKPDGEGIETFSAAERAAAMDVLAGGREDAFVTAAATLVGQGDHALALEIIRPGLLRHPSSAPLAELRRTALRRMLAEHQISDPFKFLIYAELTGTEIGPVQ
jgi:glyoxylase-like metal-dependent hydrolase (beta-lactamase superfamily II)